MRLVESALLIFEGMLGLAAVYFTYRQSGEIRELRQLLANERLKNRYK